MRSWSITPWSIQVNIFLRTSVSIGTLTLYGFRMNAGWPEAPGVAGESGGSAPNKLIIDNVVNPRIFESSLNFSSRGSVPDCTSLT